MGKIVLIFLAVCFASAICSSSAYVHGHSGGHSYEYESHPTSYHHEEEDHTELYTAFANGIFEFFAKLVRAKVEVLLWLKKAIILLLIKGVSHLRHLFVHDGDFVTNIFHTGAELVKLLLTGEPHFAVPHVNRIIAEAEHEYIPHGHY